MTRRTVAVMIAVLGVCLLVFTGCSRSVDGTAVPLGGGSGTDPGSVDTDKYDGLTLECTRLLSLDQIATTVGGTTAESTFNGAICRWVVTGVVVTGVTFNWFETGTVSVEKETAKKLGYETENVRIASTAAFTQRDPRRPAACGVTANSPARGVYTWWVEPRTTAAAADPCAAPTKLMELVLTGGQ